MGRGVGPVSQILAIAESPIIHLAQRTGMCRAPLKNFPGRGSKQCSNATAALHTLQPDGSHGRKPAAGMVQAGPSILLRRPTPKNADLAIWSGYLAACSTYSPNGVWHSHGMVAPARNSVTRRVAPPTESATGPNRSTTARHGLSIAFDTNRKEDQCHSSRHNLRS